MGDTLTLRLYITRGAKLCHSTRDLVGYYPDFDWGTTLWRGGVVGDACLGY